jgi:hypothetical protein
LDRKGEERIEWFGRKKNKEERRGMEKRHKRNIRTMKFINYTAPIASVLSAGSVAMSNCMCCCGCHRGLINAIKGGAGNKGCHNFSEGYSIIELENWWWPQYCRKWVPWLLMCAIEVKISLEKLIEVKESCCDWTLGSWGCVRLYCVCKAPILWTKELLER